MKLLTLLLGASAIVFVTAVKAQTPGQRPSFEVASIKPNNSGRDGGGAAPRGDRFVANNVTLKNLMFFAYLPRMGRLFSQQIVGGPIWSNTDHFDVEAKADAGRGTVPIDQMRLMVQSMLEDRFQLKVRREMRDLPVYNLVVAKGGLKMKPSADQTAPDPRKGFIDFTSLAAESAPLTRGAMRVAKGPGISVLTANSIPISALVNNLLQGQSDRIVFDKTDLKELFDIDLRFSNEGGPALSPGADAPPPSDPSGPSLFTAIQELGLKLEPDKALLEVIVIDSVSKPTEN